jgi:hypothetical protein
MTKSPWTNLKISDIGRHREQSEATVLKRFEDFFLFEFYVRYLQRSPNQEFNQLLKLKESIRQRFIELQVVDMLEEYTFCDNEVFPEDRYSLEIDLDALVNWTLDAIQVSDCQLFWLNSDLLRVSLTEEHLDRLFLPFREHEESIEPSLQMLYYRFSDLTSFPNDISFVLEWWIEHLDDDFRDKHKLLGEFGLASVQKDDGSEDNDADDVLHSSFPPLTVPQVLLFKKTNYELYDTAVDEVSINGQQLANSVVLSIQFDQGAENMDEILREFLSRFYGKQIRYFIDAMDSGTHPGFRPQSESKLVSSIRKPPKDNYCLITRYDSIAKFLSGLVCYDAYRPEHGSLMSVAEDILVKHQRIKLADAGELVQYYYEIKKKIKNINKTFRKKYPSEATRFHAG